MQRTILAVFTVISILIAVLPVTAQTDSRGFEIDPEFNPNFIISDDDLFDSTSMTRDRVMSFLSTKGTLGDRIETDIDGNPKYVADIVMRVSNSYKISPRFLLVLIQKEQSLVEDPSPSQGQLDWAAGYGVCDNCAKDDPSIQDFKGFANQLEYAARQMREKYYIRYLSYGHFYTAYKPGQTTDVDGVAVTPVNFATAALYAYTPHIHGNMNLWSIWRRWFNKNYPDGTVVKGDPSGKIYWLRFGEKRPFESNTVAATLVDLEKIITISDMDLAGYDEGAAIQFPNYALLRDSGGKIWLLVDDERRHIVNMDTFQKFGFNLDEVQDVEDVELTGYAIGSKITLDDQYPRGQLVQVKGDRAIWYAEGNKRYVLKHATLWTLYFNKRRPQEIPLATFESLENAGPYLLHDGELVKSDDASAVYVIEHGERRPITSEEVFLDMGYEWSSIETIPGTVLEEYTIGIPIMINEETPKFPLAV